MWAAWKWNQASEVDVDLGYTYPGAPPTFLDALREASERWQEILVAAGVSEEEAVAGFKQWRARQKR